MRVILVTLAAGFTATAAYGQDSCSKFVGQSVTPLTFQQAITKVPKVAPKGEFETTAQFESRRAAAGSPRELIVAKEPEDRKYLEYNADTQRLGIKSYAFKNRNFSAWDAFYGTPAYDQLEPSTMGNIQVVINFSEAAGGTYQATNGLGNKFMVSKLNRKVEAIFDRKPARGSYSEGLFPVADKDPYMVGYLDIPLADAPRAKSSLKLAYVVEPKEPYLVQNSYKVGETTSVNGTDVTETATVLIADIRCGLVTDAANRVLGAYETR
ncbi:MAG TPA: hypothetical protein VGB70_02980 [Allosphingosinicella sp.]|jgi:hypothetical protein